MTTNPLHNITYGMYILTSQYNKRDNGCIVDTLIQVADKKISVTVNKQNLTCEYILKSNKFNASIINEKADFELFKHWGFNSGRDIDKTTGINYLRSYNGLIYLPDYTNAYISGQVYQTIDLTTHMMFIADMTAGEVLNDEKSMTYNYYQTNVKKEIKNSGWTCSICGYVYEGDNLPEDYICPLCGHPASDFIKNRS